MSYSKRHLAAQLLFGVIHGGHLLGVRVMRPGVACRLWSWRRRIRPQVVLDALGGMLTADAVGAKNRATRPARVARGRSVSAATPTPHRCPDAGGRR